jgi:hypothetical protein
MKVKDLVDRAFKLLNRLPLREMSDDTAAKYTAQFRQMWRSGNLDPLRDGDPLDTYYFRRASFFAIAPRWINNILKPILKADENSDAEAAIRGARLLKRLLDRIEPVLDLEPPSDPAVPPSQRPPSRWCAANPSGPERGATSKKHLLGMLPEGWDNRLWETATSRGWKYLKELALHLLTPVRPEELVPGDRPSGPSEGVLLEIDQLGHLAMTFVPVKSHGGRFGTEVTTITVDPKIVGGPAAFLANLCVAAGNRLTISSVSKNAVRKAMEPLGKKALPGVNVTVTPYLLRNQKIADFKVTFPGGPEASTGAGHGSGRSRAKYGFMQHGRKLEGYSVTAKRQPRCDNVERAHQLSASKKRLHQEKEE